MPSYTVKSKIAKYFGTYHVFVVALMIAVHILLVGLEHGFKFDKNLTAIHLIGYPLFGMVVLMVSLWISKQLSRWIVEPINGLYDKLKAQGKHYRIAPNKNELENIADIYDQIHKKNERYLKEINKAHDRALRASEAKSIFLANMSHEIRTPLNGIIGMSQILVETELDHHQKKLAETVVTCSEALLTLINDILDLSKIEAGKLEIVRQKADFPLFVERLTRIFQVPIEDKNLSFNVNVDSKIPRYLEFDEGRLKQVLINLLGNSLKFTSSGAITLNIALIEDQGEQCKIRFDVIDTGIGMSPEQVGKLFQPFTQASHEIHRKYGGTGLGLAITQKICEHMDGSIECQSTENTGTTFTVKINFKVPSNQSKIVSLPNHGDVSYASPVLVAEDNQTNQQLIFLLLKKFGINPTIVNDGKAVIEELRSKQYDLILMDMQMPVMDGISATKEILRLWGESAPPIVAMTANAFEDDRRACLKAGMKDFITKPISKKKLTDIISKYCTINHKPFKEATLDSAENIAEYLDEQFGEDLDILEAFFTSFQAKHQTYRDRMKAAVEQGDVKLFGEICHEVKGIVSNLGPSDCLEQVKKTENSIKLDNYDNDWDHILFEKNLDNLLRLVQEYLRSRGSEVA